MSLKNFSVFLLFPLIVGCTTSKLQQQTSLAPSVKELRSFPAVTCASDSSTRKAVRTRHIVIEVSTDAPEDKVRAAYAKAVEVRSALTQGESFVALENRFSAGAISRGLNGGNLDYFAKGTMVPEFEKMAFCLPLNETSPVFSTGFGFHILEVTGVK